jgi:putative peptidoglycan lipid II flippase
MIPALFGVSVSQINLLLDTVIASFLQTGSISWLYYSDRLLEFPLGLFGIAIATVILPTLSRNHVSKDKQAFSKNIDWAFRIVAMLGIPAGAALMVLAMPLMLVIFQRGAFSVDTAHMASLSLMAYAIGLFGFMLVKIFAPAFYSRQDTKTPVKYGIITMAINMVLNLILAIPLGYVGLALATSISGIMNAVLLYRRLSFLEVYRISKDTWWFLAKITLATVVMVIAVFAYSANLAWVQSSFSQRVEYLCYCIAIGIICYAISILILGVRPHQLIGKKVKK